VELPEGEVQQLWSTPIRVWNLQDAEGPEFSKALADAAVAGFNGFIQTQASGDEMGNPEDNNDEFFQWQQSKLGKDARVTTTPAWKAGTGWKRMKKLPQFQKLKRYADTAFQPWGMSVMKTCCRAAFKNPGLLWPSFAALCPRAQESQWRSTFHMPGPVCTATGRATSLTPMATRFCQRCTMRRSPMMLVPSWRTIPEESDHSNIPGNCSEEMTPALPRYPPSESTSDFSLVREISLCFHHG